MQSIHRRVIVFVDFRLSALDINRHEFTVIFRTKCWTDLTIKRLIAATGKFVTAQSQIGTVHLDALVGFTTPPASSARSR